MRNKNDIITALNGGKDLNQDVYVTKTLNIDLLALLRDNKIIQNRGFGSHSLLTDYRFSENEMTLTVQEGTVEIDPEPDTTER